MNILVTEPKEIHREAIELLKQHSHTVITDESKADPSNIEALFIRTYTKVDGAYLDRFPAVKYILRSGVGLDNIDVTEAKNRGIAVINSPGSNANAVAEFAVGLIIALMRNVLPQVDRLKNGDWRDASLQGSEIPGKTVGLIGCGAIGRLIVQKMSGFGIASTLGYDPFLDKETLAKNSIEKCELADLISRADIVSLHLPLTPETRGLISMKELKTMKRTAYLINTSRGGIVNETDLIQALRKGIIAGAALDVFENEPEINMDLTGLDNLIATPHIAAFTAEADRNMSVQAVENFLKTYGKTDTDR